MPSKVPPDITKTRRDVMALIAELQSRNIPIPQDIKDRLVSIKRPVVIKKNEFGCFYRNEDGKPFEPNEKQAPFIFSLARYSGLFAGRGSGKTASGSQKSINKITDGWDGAVLNPDFENFKISTWPEFRSWIPWDLVIPTHRHRQNPGWTPNQPFNLVFDLGWKQVTVICKGLKDPGSARGPNINWLWYDEAGRDRDGEAWRYAVPSVRVGENPQAFVTTTPVGMDHWTYEFFVDQLLPQEVLDLLGDSEIPLIDYYFTTIFDNEKNLDPMFMAAMLATYPSGWLRRQEIYGEFVSREGAIGGDAAEALRTSLISYPPENVFSRVRFYDLAATEKKMVGGRQVNDPDETVGTLMSWDRQDFYIEDQSGGFFAWEAVKEHIYNTALKDGSSVKIYVEQEPGSGGKNQVAEIASFIRDRLPGYPKVEGWNPKDAGDRVMGANYWFAEAVQGQVKMVRGDWNDDCIKQIANFPLGKHDDKVTSITGARHSIAPIRKWKSIPFLSLSRRIGEKDE